jgi:hypothetical protein
MIAVRDGFHWWRLLLLLAIFRLFPCLPALAAAELPLTTPAGLLVIEPVNDQPPDREFKVYLDRGDQRDLVLHIKEGDRTDEFSDYPEPVVVGYFGEPIGKFDAVAVFQQFNSGTGCNGGPIWFLGINRDGSFTRSDKVENCGGPKPQLKVENGVVHLTFEWTYSGPELKPGP